MTPDGAAATDDRQRLDKWLWCARFVKTRALAAALARDGFVRINGVRTENAGRALRIGDVLTVSLPSRVLVVRVLALADRRGPATEARGLYAEPGRSGDGGAPV